MQSLTQVNRSDSTPFSVSHEIGESLLNESATCARSLAAYDFVVCRPPQGARGEFVDGA